MSTSAQTSAPPGLATRREWLAILARTQTYDIRAARAQGILPDVDVSYLAASMAVVLGLAAVARRLPAGSVARLVQRIGVERRRERYFLVDREQEKSQEVGCRGSHQCQAERDPKTTFDCRFHASHLGQDRSLTVSSSGCSSPPSYYRRHAIPRMSVCSAP